jgi:hypothetical protein
VRFSTMTRRRLLRGIRQNPWVSSLPRCRSRAFRRSRLFPDSRTIPASRTVSRRPGRTRPTEPAQLSVVNLQLMLRILRRWSAGSVPGVAPRKHVT